jgi:hypothetical protein
MRILLVRAHELARLVVRPRTAMLIEDEIS